MYGRNRYKKNRTSTAQPGDLVVMLYEGMLRFTAEARQHIHEGDPKNTGYAFTRALDIVSHLQDTLRMDVAPDLGKALDTTYTLWTKLLVEANIHKDIEKLDAVRLQMTELKDAWSTANEEIKRKTPKVA
jgi:flagellar secretion chaperone FliS